VLPFAAAAWYHQIESDQYRIKITSGKIAIGLTTTVHFKVQNWDSYTNGSFELNLRLSLAK
jgi:hypothetical protein